MNYTCPTCHKTSPVRFVTVPRDGKLPTVMVVDHEDDCPMSICPPTFVRSMDIDRCRLERLAVDVEELDDIIGRMMQIIARHEDGRVKDAMANAVKRTSKAVMELNRAIKDGMTLSSAGWGEMDEQDAYEDKHAREV